MESSQPKVRLDRQAHPAEHGSGLFKHFKKLTHEEAQEQARYQAKRTMNFVLNRRNCNKFDKQRRLHTHELRDMSVNTATENVRILRSHTKMCEISS